MANFSVKASFDGSELVQGFKDVKTEINGLANAGKTAQKSLGEMLQKKNSTSDYRRQLSLLSRELTDLTVNYRRMSEAEQQSEFGVALKQRIDELTAKASEFKDAMLDVQQSINKSASDTANWDAFQSLIDITSSSLQTFVGVTGMSEDSVAALTRTIAIMQTTGAAANTMIKVGNALQKQSALMLGVARVQNAAAAAAIRIKTVAEGKGVVVTKAATVAQKAFNVVAKANPYVLLASVILGVGAALVGFVKKTKDAEREQEAYNKRIEEQTERENSRREAVSSSVGDVVGKYKLLQLEWNNLKTAEEKNEWIANNTSAFNDLGLAINDIISAQRILVELSDDVINALKLQAEAAALSDLYKESFKAVTLKQIEKEDKKAPIKSGYKPTEAEMEHVDMYGKNHRHVSALAGIISYWTETGSINQSGAKQLSSYYDSIFDPQIAELQAESDVIAKKLGAKQQEATDAANKIKGAFTAGGKGGSGGGGGSTTKPDIFAEDSLRAAQQEVQKLQDKLHRMSPNDAAFETTKQQLIDAQTKVKELQDKMKSPDAVISPDSLKGLQKEVSTLQNKLNEMSPDDAAFEPTLQQLNEAKAKVKELQDKMREPVTPLTKTEQLVKAYDDAGKQISDIVKQYEIGVIDEVEAKKQIDEINKELQKLGLKPIEIQLKPKVTIADKYGELSNKISDTLRDYDIGAIGPKKAKELINSINAEIEKLGLKPIQVHLNTERAMQAVDGLAAHFSMLTSAGSIVQSMDSIYKAFKDLPEAMDEAKNGWERFMVGFNAGMQVLNAIVSIFGAINTLMTTFNTIQEITTALKTKDTVATTAQMAADTSAAGATMTKAGANMAEAATGAGKAVSWLPIVGPILAVAAIGAIMGVMLGVMSKSKYATGGIVPGSGIGDMDLVRVNGGEMILNGRQQKNLFNLIDHNRLSPSLGSSGEVTFRIQGDTLVGTLNNYYKKRGKA